MQAPPLLTDGALGYGVAQQSRRVTHKGNGSTAFKPISHRIKDSVSMAYNEASTCLPTTKRPRCGFPPRCDGAECQTHSHAPSCESVTQMQIDGYMSELPFPMPGRYTFLVPKDSISLGASPLGHTQTSVNVLVFWAPFLRVEIWVPEMRPIPDAVLKCGRGDLAAQPGSCCRRHTDTGAH